jgi:hypothetical protein
MNISDKIKYLEKHLKVNYTAPTIILENIEEDNLMQTEDEILTKTQELKQYSKETHKKFSLILTESQLKILSQKALKEIITIAKEITILNYKEESK